MPKDVQFVAQESIDRYNQRCQSDTSLKQGTVVDLGQPTSVFKSNPASRFYGEASLAIVFKESNSKFSVGRRYFQFGDRAWVYATNAHIRVLCTNSQRHVFKEHTGYITDICLASSDNPSSLLLVSGDTNRRVCVWSLHDKGDTVSATVHMVSDLVGSAYPVHIGAVPVGSDKLKLVILLSNNQVSVYDLPLNLTPLNNEKLPPPLVLLEPATQPREISLSSNSVIVSTANRITGFSLARLNTEFDFETTSKSGNIIFLQEISQAMIAVATMTSIQLWSLTPEPFLSQVIQVDLRNYRLRAFTPPQSPQLWSIVGCPLDFPPHGPTNPLLAFHLNSTGRRFTIDYISEFEVPNTVLSFQVIPSTQTPNGIDVYLMHNNYMINLKLGSKALVNVPPTKQQQGGAQQTQQQQQQLPPFIPPQQQQQPQPAINTSNMSAKDKLVRLQTILKMQNDQITSMMEQVATQAEVVKGLTNELNAQRLPATLETSLLEIDRKINSLRGRLGGDSSSGADSAKMKKISDEVAQMLTTSVPRIVVDALTKVCSTKETRLTAAQQAQIASDVAQLAQAHIQQAVGDASQVLLRTLGEQSKVVQQELRVWREDIQRIVQRVQTAMATAGANPQSGNTGSSAPAQPPAFSQELVTTLIHQRQFNDAIKLAVATKKFDDIAFVLGVMGQVVDKDTLLSSGEVSVESMLALLAVLASELRDTRTADLRLEWIQSIGTCDFMNNRKPETKQILGYVSEKLAETKDYNDYSPATKKLAKVTANLFK